VHLPTLRATLLACFSLLATSAAFATDAGLRQLTVPNSAGEAGPISVALYYPTQAQARPVAMGPFTVHVAIQGPIDAKLKGLIVLSHGRGGTEVGYTSIAEALARHGYLVAALRHPGDNFQDRSLLQKSVSRYFSERPRDVSRVIDALLQDPEWKGRIAADARGPRIGAVGHSAGGYTVLALAGAQPDLARNLAHCQEHGKDDPILCGIAARDRPLDREPRLLPPLADPRVRAVVALSPLAVTFSAESLAGIRVPTLVYAAERDRFLVPRFHAQWAASNVPGAEFRNVPNAWHFAFMDAPGNAIPTEDGDLAADPPGFDRAAFLARLGAELCVFFDEALR
jgi:predicted dienelactone hydrolase